MKTIIVTNHKGGIGKTTLAINISAGLAIMLALEARERKAKRVLLIDMDPQAHASATLAGGVLGDRTYYDLSLGNFLLGDTDLSALEAVQTSHIPTNGAGNLDFIPSDKTTMAQAERVLLTDVDGQYYLKDMLETMSGAYEYIVIDTPPAMNIMTINALLAGSDVLVPIQLEAFSIDGLNDVLSTMSKVQKRNNPALRLLGLQPNQCNLQRSEQRELLEELHKHFKGQVLEPIADRADITYANTSGIDIFSLKPSRDRLSLASANDATKEMARCVETVRAIVDNR